MECKISLKKKGKKKKSQVMMSLNRIMQTKAKMKDGGG